MIFDLFQTIVAALSLWPVVLLFLVVGVALLKYGADWLVDGASNIGFRFGISATLIGLTVVAFGTSAPELVVSVLTAVEGKPELCLGNVIGSNVANTFLILGCTALVMPLKINTDTIKRDAPLSFVSALLIVILAVVGFKLSRIDGLILLGAFAAWMIWMARKSLHEKRRGTAKPVDEHGDELQFHKRHAGIDIGLILVGLAALVVGAETLVVGATQAAVALNVSDMVVGLTIVAGGTSLPELAVSLMAALKKQGDITVGNVMGSNIFNALLILGTAIIIMPIDLSYEAFSLAGNAGTLWLDIPFCAFACALVIPMMTHRRHLSRFKGVVLVALYVGYIVTLVLRSS